MWYNNRSNSNPTTAFKHKCITACTVYLSHSNYLLIDIKIVMVGSIVMNHWHMMSFLFFEHLVYFENGFLYILYWLLRWHTFTYLLTCPLGSGTGTFLGRIVSGCTSTMKWKIKKRWQKCLIFSPEISRSQILLIFRLTTREQMFEKMETHWARPWKLICLKRPQWVAKIEYSNVFFNTFILPPDL